VTIVVGTVIGLVVALALYAFTVQRKPSAENAFADRAPTTSLDMSTPAARAGAFRLVSAVLRSTAAVCMTAPSEELTVVLQRGEADMLEVRSFVDVEDPAARDCIRRALRQIRVGEARGAVGPWSVTVALAPQPSPR
jgi:hypothetical protein